LAFEAVQLFVDRAQALHPEFPTDAKTLAHVAAICRQLDGIPLAIELAAARIRTLSVAQIAARLYDCMALLKSRHRTMAATLTWSYDLLAEPERTLLRRVAIFARGWSLEAAEAVCADETIPSPHVLDLLSSLVHKSLVVTRQYPDEVRYSLLEPVRQYAYQHLCDRDEHDEMHDRHLAYFAGMIRRAAAHLTEAQQLVWFEQVELDIDNLRIAMDRAIVLTEETGHPAAIRQALTLPADLERFWSARMYMREGSERLQRALSIAGAQSADVVLARAYALNAASIVTWLQGNYAEAQQLVEEALAIGEATEDEHTLIVALRNFGTLAVLRRDLEKGISLLERGLALERACGGSDPYSAAWTIAVLGSAAYLQGDDARARARFEESITLFRALGNVNFLALSLRRLGQLALRGNAPRQAYTLLYESLDLNYQIGSHAGVAGCLVGIAGVHLAQGRPTDAAHLLGSVQSLLTETAGHFMAVDRELFDILCERTRAWLGDAFDAAWAHGLAVRGKPEIMKLVYYAPRVAAVAEPTPRWRKPSEALTAREREVTRLVAEGCSNRDIAQALTVEVKTIEAHLTRIFAKLGATSRVQLAMWARQDEDSDHAIQ
jgi:non-specific serine/threonine protein kinase